jgi:hypothetical protein
MSSPSVSSIEDINAAIQSFNPFEKPAIVTHQDVWGKGFPDVPNLNAHASDAVFRAIDQARSGEFVKNSITLTAEPGSGKSHIISRIRHRLQNEGGALFVYMGKYDSLRLIKPEFQQVLAESLNQYGSQGVRQWQELAVAMVNQVRGTNHSPKKIVEEFNTVSLEKIDDLTESILETKFDTDPYVMKAILWTLSNRQVLFANKWLSGKDIDSRKANDLGLPNPGRQEQGIGAFDTIKQILDLISNYYTLIICFDEVDGIGGIDPDETETSLGGYTKPQVVASLVKDLWLFRLEYA